MLDPFLVACLSLSSAVITSSIALHQLIELVSVEFTFVSLTVLHVNLDLIMIQDTICWQHACKYITALIILVLFVSVLISKTCGLTHQTDHLPIGTQCHRPVMMPSCLKFPWPIEAG